MKKELISLVVSVLGLGMVSWLTFKSARFQKKVLKKLEEMENKDDNLQRIIMTKSLIDLRDKLENNRHSNSEEENSMLDDLMTKVTETLKHLSDKDEPEEKEKSNNSESKSKDKGVKSKDLKDIKEKVKDFSKDVEATVEDTVEDLKKDLKEGIGDLMHNIGLATPDESDDLKAIKGIGPKYEETLNDIGIFTYGQMSKLKVADLKVLAEETGLSLDTMREEEWVKQAKALLKNKD